ncbi:MAG: ParB/RepB/Spo0J family partition protein [Gammaproteobacteria bacterium]|nr:ParB/RepB/Spo0J family partition protein [Gammaproteobacteria bacterium]
MNPIPALPELLIRDIPLSALVLAPENVRKTLPDPAARDELEASIRAHGLLENLVVRPEQDDPGTRAKKTGKSKSPARDGTPRYAVIAGGRRLFALQALARDGTLDRDHPVPCRVVRHDNPGELSLAENVVRIAMHPADQVVAFARLAEQGAAVATIAGRFGVSERTVEQPLRLGNAAPELLEAYRNEEMALDTLKAFAMTIDHDRQRAVWAQLGAQGVRPSAWQVKRMLTEEKVSSASAIARYVGVDDYVAGGGQVLYDLFADEYEDGAWFDNPARLNELALKKLTAVTDKLATRWKWALPILEVDWNTLSRYGRIHPRPGKPTAKEETDLKRIRARRNELTEIDDNDWTDQLEAEAGKLEERLEAIHRKIEKRARFRKPDFALGGCIATIGRDGTLQVVQGLVRAEDLPKETESNPADGPTGTPAKDPAGDPERPDAGGQDGPSVTPPAVSVGPASSRPSGPANPEANARKAAGVGIGLAEDLRAIRAGIIKTRLAGDFEAAFDLAVFQAARAVFDRRHGRGALDIAFTPTADRPPVRTNDDEFAAWSPGEAILDDWSSLPLRWMEADDEAARFNALRALSTDKKEQLFAAAVARTVQGQLAFEDGARPELEATVVRLGIDFAKEVRPTADLLWSRLRKDHLLAIASETLGTGWAAARSKFRKADLAKAMEQAFARREDGGIPSGLTAGQHGAALAWALPGFAPVEADRAGTTKPATSDEISAETPEAAPPNRPTANGSGREATEHPDRQESDSVTGQEGEEVEIPGFLQAVH